MRDRDPGVAFVCDVLAGRPPLEARGGGADWERAVDLLLYHRLGGLWYSEALRGAGGRGVAGEAVLAGWEGSDLLGLEGAYVRTALHSALVVESARRARGVLAEAGIASLVFKGAALLQDGTYPDPGARSVEDSDLLVPRDRAGDGVRALQLAGFEPWEAWDEGRIEWLPACAFTDRCAPEGFDVRLDLHWATPYTSFRSDGDDAGEAGSLWEGANVEEGVPAAEPHFLLLAEHFLKHVRVVAHLRGVGDLVRMLHRIGRPDVLSELAAQRGSSRGLRTMLAFMRDALGVRIAPEILSAAGVAEPTSGTPAKLFAPASLIAPARLLAPDRLMGVPGPAPLGRIRGLGVHWLLTASPWSVFRDVFDVIVPPAKWLDQRYPGVSPRWGARRRRHFRAVGAWLLGRGSSPLSPNQDFER